MTFDEAYTAVCGPGTMFEVGDGEVAGVEMPVFVHAPPNIRALFQLAAAREDDFIVYEDETWNMTRLLDLAGRIGHLLVNDYGVSVGDRVGIAMRNFPEWIAAFTAITSVGGVAVPLNAWWQADEMAYAINDSGLTVLFADEERLGRLVNAEGAGAEALAKLRVLVVRGAGTGADNVTTLDDVLPGQADMPEVEIGPEDNITILYTSGTTGNPKGAVSTHRAVVSALMCFAARAQVGALCDPPDAEDIENPPQPVFMLCVPLFHVTGLVPVMLGSFISGAKLVMTHRWDPDRALELIEREGVTNFVGVPTMAWDLLEAESFADRDLSSLRSVGGGGAPMPPELVRRIEDSFPRGRPGLGYGMTETNAYGPQNAGNDFLERP
ncbi:MAG: class I adenylate-forming enzyme family protein, partial [Actinomycetota bacterium]